nr:hypothetical protein [Tanacetum cinerariifolium]
MELVLEQTQQGTSYEVSVSAEGVEELKRKVKIKGEKKEALLTLRCEKNSILQLEIMSRRFFLNGIYLIIGRSSQIRRDMEVPGSSRLTRFIATCSYSTDIYKDIMKSQLANIFTKALCRERIKFLIDKLRMRSFTPETLKELADETEE